MKHFKKILIGLLLLIFLLAPAGSNTGAFAVFFSNIPDEYDLVAILVEKDVYQSTRNLAGIPHAQTPATTLKARVDRFAEDLQNDLSKTRALVITVDQNEKTENIAHVLERLYFEGDPEEPRKRARLAGVIVIGNVPLPVVNKSGTRFISLFPYTDFEKKAYLWNPETIDFEFDPSIANPQPEIWHGVIRPPVERSDSQYFPLIAKFFDKNHLYKIGHDFYSAFGKNIFYADVFWEKKNINPFMWKRYQNYVKYAEDTAYFRYTKEFFDVLLREMEEELHEEGLDEESLSAELRAELAANKAASLSEAQASARAADPSAPIPSGGEPEEPDTSVIPDIQTKEMINKYLAKFVDLFTKYPAKINDFTRYTGRYDLKNELDSFVNILFAKDQFTFGYLKETNTMIERAIDRIIMDELQKDIPIVKEVGIEVLEVKPVGGASVTPPRGLPGDDEAPGPGGAGPSFTPVAFVNHSPGIDVNSGDFMARILGKEMDAAPADFVGHSYGRDTVPVASVSDCTLIRGSVSGKAAEGNRLYDPYTGGSDDTDEDRERTGSDNPFSVYEEHAGCFYDSSEVGYDNDPNNDRCFPEHAIDPVFTYRGTRKVLSPPEKSGDYRACFEFREKEQYSTYLRALDYLLEVLSNDITDTSDYDTPEQLEAVRQQRRQEPLITLASRVGGGIPDDFAPYLGFRIHQIPKTKSASQIILFQDGGRTLRFADILGNQNLDDFLISDQETYTRIPVPGNPQIEWVTFRKTKDTAREIPSVFFHKEPTYEALREQNIAQATLHLPVDKPRYITFQDKNGARRQIMYPNIFQARDFEEFSGSLEAVESQLNLIGSSLGLPANAFARILTSKLSNLQDQSAADPERNNKPLSFSRMHQPKVEDAILWRNMDVEEKHRYALLTYLNPFKNGYIGEKENGYEMFVVNALGGHDNFGIDLQPEGEIPEDLAALRDERENREETIKAEQTAPDDYPDFGDFELPPPSGDPYLLFSFPEVTVNGEGTHFPWFKKTEEWLSGISNAANSAFATIAVGESEEDFYEALREKQEADLEALHEELNAEEDYVRAESITVASPFPVLLSGGNSKTNLFIQAKDKDGKVIEDEPVEVTVEISGTSAVIDNALQDVNPVLEGFQTAVFGKEFLLPLVSTNETGESIITVKVSGTDIAARLSVNVFENASIDVSTNLLGVVADGNQEIPLTVSVKDDAGNIIPSVNGFVEFSVSDSRFGGLAHEHIQLRNGEAQTAFRVSKKAGEVTIMATGGGFLPAEITLRLLPGPPAFLRLEMEEDFLDFGVGSSVNLRAKVFDENGNAVTTDNQTQVRFEIVSGEEGGRFEDAAPARARSGVSEKRLFSGDKIKKVLVRAADVSSRLTPDIFEVPVRMKVTHDDIRQNPPETLVASLLGFDGGNVAEENFLAGWFAFSGKNQAALSLTEKPEVASPVLEIHPQGGATILDPSRVKANVFSGAVWRVEFRDLIFNETIADMTITVNPDTSIIIDGGSAAAETAARPNITFVSLDSEYETRLSETGGKAELIFEGQAVMRLSKTGEINLFEDDLKLSLDEGKILTLFIQKNAKNIGKISFNQNFDTDAAIAGSGPLHPGVSVSPKETASKIKWQRYFSGNSTAGNKGVLFADEDQPLAGNRAPGFSTVGVEDSLRIQGVGFTDDAKFGQLFAAGNMFGESVKPYASDIGIIIGDPTVRISNAEGAGYTQDSGSFLSRAPDDVRELVSLDYDLDQDDDVFVAYGEGSIKLLENQGGEKKFLDRGEFIRVGNGIASLAKGDINNDGRMDLVIAGVDTCRRGDTCLDLYENKAGYFERKNIAIQQGENEKISVVKTGDLNNDGRLDLVTFDTKGNLRAYYNRGSNFETQGQLIGNMGLTINPSQNLIESVLLNYSGMPALNSASTISQSNYRALQWFEEAGGSLQERQQNFLYADLDPRFSTSTYLGTDENGGVLENGDSVRYTLTLRNEGASQVSNLKFSLVIPETMEFDRASVQCANCASGESLRAHETADRNRPYYFFGISVPPSGEKIITYKTTYRAPSTKNSNSVITIGNNFSDDYPVRDQYLDIAVSMEDNPTGQVRYFYSTGLNAQGRVIYASTLSEAEGAGPRSPEEAAEEYLQKLEDAQSDSFRENMFDQALSAFEDRKHGDADEDGIPDSLDDLEGTLDSINDSAQRIVSSLKCDAGCISLPVNAAFLSPGNFSILGNPGPFDPGLPIFAFPTSPLVPVWPIQPPYQSSLFRLYLSPTLTGGLGTGLCFGPYLLGSCITFAIDALSAISPDLCDSINGSIGSALSSANNAIHQANQGMVLNIGGAKGGGGSTANSRESGGIVNYSLGSYQAPAASHSNRRIPGFPAVITDWARAQLDEFTDKLLDGPDIYFIYPNVASPGVLLDQFTPDVKFSFPELLSWLNSIPLLDIETEDITLKLPIVTRKEFERFKYDYELWKQDLQAEWEKFKALWRCATLDEIRDFCDLVDVRVTELISQMNRNIDNLEAWIAMPKRILDYRNIEAYLARQIIDYLDTVVQYTGGYLTQQQKLIDKWVRAIREMIQVIRDWQLLLDLFLEYQESCDECKTERYGLKDLILRFFMVIPSPPVIPFPKWPDLVVDVSKIQAGLRVRWPALDIQPAPLALPKIPRIRLPEFPIPQIEILLPDIPVIPGPPSLPQLPALPELRLPELPDLLPPPPKLPPLPGEFHTTIDILKQITRLLCIIKTGLLPIPEVTLKSQIEAMTARGLTPLLPLDFLVTVQAPTVDVEYVDQIKFTNYLNFNLENQTAIDAVQGVAQDLNSASTNLSKEWRAYWEDKVQQVEKYTQPQFPYEDRLQEFGRGFQIDLQDLGPQSSLPQEEQFRLISNFLEHRFLPMLEDLKKKHEAVVKETPQELRIAVNDKPFTNKSSILQEAAVSAVSGERELTDFEKQLIDFRDSMIGYADSIETQADLFVSGNVNEALRVSQSLEKPEFLRQRNRLFASNAVSDIQATGNQNKKVKIGEIAEPRLLAQAGAGAGGGAGAAGGAAGGAPGSSDVPVKNLGLYIADPETGESKRILAYTAESNAPRKLLFLDYDKDGDQDLIYTTGGDVFFKEYYGGPAQPSFHFSEDHIEHHDLPELIPDFAAINKFNNISENVNDATVAFRKAEREISGYQMRLKKSPKFFETDGGNTDFIDLLDTGDSDAAAGALVFIDQLRGAGEFFGKKRTIISGRSGEIRLEKDEIIHSLGEARVTLRETGGEERDFSLQPFDALPITDEFGAGVTLDVRSGRVEIIGKESLSQALQEGMMLEEKERVKITSGEARIRLKNGGMRALRRNDAYTFQFISDPETPLANLNLNPGNYYGKIQSFNPSSAGVTGETVLLAPQVCLDKGAPFASAGAKKFEVPLLKTLLIDASHSRDGEGNVTEYVIDVDRDSDSDGDGDKENDRDMAQTSENPVFTLGPFAEVGKRKAKLMVFDQALNKGEVDLEINVIMPRIILTPEELPAGKIIGHIEPRDPNVPITVARNRGGLWQPLVTPSADSSGRYYTDLNGGFSVTDLDLRDILIVRNSAGEIVAEIHRRIGSVVITDDRYHLEALPAFPPDLPTRVAIVDQNGITLTFVFFVPDINTDAVIDSAQTVYDIGAFDFMTGVHIKPLSPSFTFRVLPGDSLEAPGAAEILRNENRIALIDVNGDIVFMSEHAERMRLSVKDHDLYTPMVYELYYDDSIIAEIFIVPHLPQTSYVTIVDQAQVSAVPRPRITAQARQTPFLDIASGDPLTEILNDLYDKGIMQGYEDSQGNLTFRKDKPITRAEFAKVTLDTLCIVPRLQAYNLPQAFSDIPFKTPFDWFYPWTKEANLLKLIFGYQRAADPVTGLYPYRPGNEITRAEAAKILLEALDMLDVIDMAGVNRNVAPWFEPFMNIARELDTPLLTRAESLLPTRKITRGDFALMASRVLEMRNCYDFDVDGDGLKDEWEKDHFGDLSQGGDDDPDKDTLLNREEEALGTDPLDPDTDNGGIQDGVEVRSLRTDPLNPADDRPVADRDILENEEDIFVVRPLCNSCPCLSAVELGSQLLPEDAIFGAIIDESTSEIFIRSQELTY